MYIVLELQYDTWTFVCHTEYSKYSGVHFTVHPPPSKITSTCTYQVNTHCHDVLVLGVLEYAVQCSIWYLYLGGMWPTRMML